MDAFELLVAMGDRAIVIALSTIRIAVAFLLLPLFSREGIPPLVRSSLLLALAIITVLVQPIEPIDSIGTADWIHLFAKEALIGLVIGVFFGLFLWAFESAGVIVDFQIGMSFALFFDPIIGNEATLFGTFLSRWANYLFLAAGGLLLLVGALIESFAIWPLLEPITDLRQSSVRLFEAELSRFMSLTVRIAAPIMLAIFLVDVLMGLINRYAPQFNVLFLSMSLKALAATVMLMVLLPFLVGVLVDEVQTQAADIQNHLRRVIQ